LYTSAFNKLSVQYSNRACKLGVSI